MLAGLGGDIARCRRAEPAGSLSRFVEDQGEAIEKSSKTPDWLVSAKQLWPTPGAETLVESMVSLMVSLWRDFGAESCMVVYGSCFDTFG